MKGEKKVVLKASDVTQGLQKVTDWLTEHSDKIIVKEIIRTKKRTGWVVTIVYTERIDLDE